MSDPGCDGKCATDECVCPQVDPAVEAAQRATAKDGGFVTTHDIAAAREALAPLRELHRIGVYGYCKECGHEGGRWPCDSARLVYREDELA